MEEGVPEYWIVDPGLKQVERWKAGDAAPEVLTAEIDWHPIAEAPALRVDLASLFAAAAL